MTAVGDPAAGDSTRRVVAAERIDGAPEFVADGPVPKCARWADGEPPALEWIWATETVPRLPAAPADPTAAVDAFFPPAGGSRFFVETFFPGFGTEPDSVATTRAHTERLAGAGITAFAAVMGTEGAVHATRSIDYGVVLSGRIDLRLASGAAVTLAAGDCIVQLGASHAWRNRYTEACRIAFIVLGAAAEAPVAP